MPELPEVEVIMRGVTPHLISRKIVKISIHNKNLRIQISKQDLARYITGTTVHKIARRAKYLTVTMDNGAMLIFHFGMTGKLGIFKHQCKITKHDHIRFCLDNETELRFNDVRRFGSVLVFPPKSSEKTVFFQKLGPEPFSEMFCDAYLQKSAANKKKPVKNFLMDSRIVVGIGNIYASEILFAAKIMPDTPAGELSTDNWHQVSIQTPKILKKAIAAGGSTISDFVNSNGERGYFQLDLKVYGRAGDTCCRCGNRIQKTKMAGRSTFFCCKCQK